MHVHQSLNPGPTTSCVMLYRLPARFIHKARVVMVPCILDKVILLPLYQLQILYHLGTLNGLDLTWYQTPSHTMQPLLLSLIFLSLFWCLTESCYMTHLYVCSRPKKERSYKRWKVPKNVPHSCSYIYKAEAIHLSSASCSLDLGTQAPESWCPLIYLNH